MYAAIDATVASAVAHKLGVDGGVEGGAGLAAEPRDWLQALKGGTDAEGRRGKTARSSIPNSDSGVGAASRPRTSRFVAFPRFVGGLGGDPDILPLVPGTRDGGLLPTGEVFSAAVSMLSRAAAARACVRGAGERAERSPTLCWCTGVVRGAPYRHRAPPARAPETRPASPSTCCLRAAGHEKSCSHDGEVDHRSVDNRAHLAVQDDALRHPRAGGA